MFTAVMLDSYAQDKTSLALLNVIQKSYILCNYFSQKLILKVTTLSKYCLCGCYLASSHITVSNEMNISFKKIKIRIKKFEKFNFLNNVTSSQI